MSGNQKLGLVLGIVALGVVAALPFARREQPPAGMQRSGPSRIGAPEVPLHLTAEASSSPAVGLYDSEPGDDPSRLWAPASTRSRLDDHGLPPDLPQNYQPLLESSGVRAPHRPSAAAEELPPLSIPPLRGSLRLDQPRLRIQPSSDTDLEMKAQQRPHVLRDGDTLAKLAERYWNDASLADELFAANRDVLARPDPLPLGVTLRIPPRPATSAPTVSGPSGAEELPAPVKQPSLAPATPAPGESQLVPIPAGAFPGR